MGEKEVNFHRICRMGTEKNNVIVREGEKQAKTLFNTGELGPMTSK